MYPRNRKNVFSGTELRQCNIKNCKKTCFWARPEQGSQPGPDFRFLERGTALCSVGKQLNYACLDQVFFGAYL